MSGSFTEAVLPYDVFPITQLLRLGAQGGGYHPDMVKWRSHVASGVLCLRHQLSALRTIFLNPHHGLCLQLQYTSSAMEEDRAATNLGPLVEDGLREEPAAPTRQPKRRFVGKRTAEKVAGKTADPNANIEESSAIQGVRPICTEIIIFTNT